MNPTISTDRSGASQGAAAWSGVLALALGAFALIASEFMPVSLLTPIAADLHVSEGQAGQAISISGAFAVLTSLFVSALAGRLDRKILLLGLTVLMMVSGTIVAFAPNHVVFMLGRALIGVVIGGFWSMSAAVVMRLVPEQQVSRAMAIVNGGNALATVIAAPLGSYIAALVGWRWAFFCVVPVTAIALGWKLLSLPSMAVAPGAGSFNVARVAECAPLSCRSADTTIRPALGARPGCARPGRSAAVLREPPAGRPIAGARGPDPGGRR